VLKINDEVNNVNQFSDCTVTVVHCCPSPIFCVTKLWTYIFCKANLQYHVKRLLAELYLGPKQTIIVYGVCDDISKNACFVRSEGV